MGATGTWPAITPESFSADVYQESADGTTLTLFEAGATVRNWYAAGLDAGKTVTLIPGAAGAYVVIAQSCV